MSDPSGMDPKEFRDALGRFATGVTIVTTRDGAGAPVGVTANSYNSVSLDPPLVLWSLAKSSRSMPAFQQAGAFTIHVLAADQQDLANRFASSGADKFAGLRVEQAHGGVPLLPGCAAHFECENTYQYEGGDHIIIVGRVVRFEKRDAPPLLFHRGKFAEVRGGTDHEADYTNNDLTYLLARASARFARFTRRFQDEIDVTELEYRTMGVLSISGPMPADDLLARVALTGATADRAALARMQDKGWLQSDAADTWSLSADGREVFLQILSRSRAAEDDLVEDIDPILVRDAKAFLRLLIDKTGTPLP